MEDTCLEPEDQGQFAGMAQQIAPVLVGAGDQNYYDSRFSEGYADFWPASRYVRLASLLRELNLPSSGRALDFGCGNGSFSQMLADTLPGWTVVGSDISAIALSNSSANTRGVSFASLDSLKEAPETFDLIFSHHVLEHVPDLDEAWQLFRIISTRRAVALIVMPCGNAGSLEHRLCALRRDGIDFSREGRFVFDDEPHVRRATSERLQDAAAKAGFTLIQAHYSQQFWSQLWPFAQKSLREIAVLVDPSHATSATAAVRLWGYRALIMGVALASKPTLYRWRLKPRQARRLGDHVRHALALAGSVVSTPLTRWLRYMDEREWRTRNTDSRGAEMYLAFAKRL